LSVFVHLVIAAAAAAAAAAASSLNVANGWNQWLASSF
jgi:hypothetical protein